MAVFEEIGVRRSRTDLLFLCCLPYLPGDFVGLVLFLV